MRKWLCIFNFFLYSFLSQLTDRRPDEVFDLLNIALIWGWGWLFIDSCRRPAQR